VTTELTGLCTDHSFETAMAMCRRCGLEFCDECVVQPRNGKVFCKHCAMIEAGVRSKSERPAMAGRALRKRVKAFEDRRAAAGITFDEPELADPVLEESAPAAAARRPEESFADDFGEPELSPTPSSLPAPPGAAAAPARTATATMPPPPPPPSDEGGVDWSNPFG